MPANSAGACQKIPSLYPKLATSDTTFWCMPAEYCWRGLFAGVTFSSKITPAKFKMRQQNFRGKKDIIYSPAKSGQNCITPMFGLSMNHTLCVKLECIA
jgi:hypothetical protein